MSTTVQFIVDVEFDDDDDIDIDKIEIVDIFLEGAEDDKGLEREFSFASRRAG